MKYNFKNYKIRLQDCKYILLECKLYMQIVKEMLKEMKTNREGMLKVQSK